MLLLAISMIVIFHNMLAMKYKTSRKFLVNIYPSCLCPDDLFRSY